MSFDAKQRADLEAPLNGHVVSKRNQSGRTLDYIEGWYAISEANRIFGFDGWMRETMELRLVAEHERTIGQAGTVKGWGVSYIAKVRATVFAGEAVLVREGIGSGHGIDRDLGLAHESAAKEAETDALKRALMTFGNPFGLALYDKSRASVVYDMPEPQEPVAVKPKAQARGDYDKLVKEIAEARTSAALIAWATDEKARIEALPHDWKPTLREEYQAKLADLKTEEQAIRESEELGIPA